MLAVSAVATEFHCVELSSGKCDVLVRHFQTAVVSVGFEIDAIISYKRDRRASNVITPKSHIIQKHHVIPVSYGNSNLAKKNNQVW